MATIRLLGILAEKIGQKRIDVTLGEPTELRKIFPLPFKEEDVLILIDGKAGHLTSLIEDKNSIEIMPMLSGG